MDNCFKGIYEGKRVLVTGHTGFKGGWLSLWLKELGAEVLGYSLGPPTRPSLFEAIRLDDKTTEFIPFTKLDSYNIQTIFDSNTSVQINYQKYTEINQLIRLYDTYNVEYHSNYYRLQFDFVDDTGGPPSIPIGFMILSHAISIILLIATILVIIIVIINVLRIIRRAGIL